MTDGSVDESDIVSDAAAIEGDADDANCPKMIEICNKYIWDQIYLDQMKTTYQCYMRSKLKFFLRMIFCFMNIVVNDACCAYSELDSA